MSRSRHSVSCINGRRVQRTRKWEKAFFSRRLRRAIKKAIPFFDPDKTVLPDRKALCDPWEFD